MLRKSSSDVYDYTLYIEALRCKERNDNDEMQEFYAKHRRSVGDVINFPPNISTQGLELETMTNRDFLKQFIRLTVAKNKLFCVVPEWKRICKFFLSFVSVMLGITDFVVGISTRSKTSCLGGIVLMCAWAGFICSLIFHWPLFVLIVSSIITGIMPIVSLVSNIILYVSILKTRQKSGKDIDTFFDLVDEINRYLGTSDLPPKETSFNQKEIFEDLSIGNKIKNVETEEDKKKKLNLDLGTKSEYEKK